jgi:hypothetical protein
MTDGLPVTATYDLNGGSPPHSTNEWRIKQQKLILEFLFDDNRAPWPEEALRMKPLAKIVGGWLRYAPTSHLKQVWWKTNGWRRLEIPLVQHVALAERDDQLIGAWLIGMLNMNNVGSKLRVVLKRRDTR